MLTSQRHESPDERQRHCPTPLAFSPPIVQTPMREKFWMQIQAA